ncbi:hypothetical protein D9M72_555310 [compost metagenome]
MDGQVRSGRLMAGKARYLEDGSFNMLMSGILFLSGQTGLRASKYKERAETESMVGFSHAVAG